MCRCPGCGSRLSPVEVLDLAAQRLFIYVPQDRVVHLGDRGQRALAEAGNSAQGIAPVGRGVAHFVGALLALFRESQVESETMQQAARSSRVACRSPANANEVFPLWL